MIKVILAKTHSGVGEMGIDMSLVLYINFCYYILYTTYSFNIHVSTCLFIYSIGHLYNLTRASGTGGSCPTLSRAICLTSSSEKGLSLARSIGNSSSVLALTVVNLCLIFFSSPFFFFFESTTAARMKSDQPQTFRRDSSRSGKTIAETWGMASYSSKTTGTPSRAILAATNIPSSARHSQPQQMYTGGAPSHERAICRLTSGCSR